MPFLWDAFFLEEPAASVHVQTAESATAPASFCWHDEKNSKGSEAWSLDRVPLHGTPPGIWLDFLWQFSWYATQDPDLDVSEIATP